MKLTAEQLAELDEAIAEAERGEGVPADEFIRDLRNEYVPTAEEALELEESMAQLDRGEYVDGDEFLQSLRRRRQQS